MIVLTAVISLCSLTLWQQTLQPMPLYVCASSLAGMPTILLLEPLRCLHATPIAGQPHHSHDPVSTSPATATGTILELHPAPLVGHLDD